MAPNPSSKKSIFIMGMVTIFVIVGTTIISLLARGYRLNLQNGPILSPTGLISATSKPKSASVYLNNRLFTATDDTINLPPGDYTIKIAKDGYLPWEKNIQVKSEIVYQTDTDLFRSAPDLRPISLTGAINPSASPDNTKIAFAVASASATKDNGLYLYENNNLPLPLVKSSPKLLSQNLPGIDWSKADFTFSPNSRQLLVTFKLTNTHYLFNLDTFANNRQLYDITPQLSIILTDWVNQEKEIINSKFDRVPTDLKAMISTTSAKDILFSSDTANELILYLASSSGQLKSQLPNPPPAQSTQKQQRQIKKDFYYVYDPKEDTNFEIGPQNDVQYPSWLPNTNDIVYVSHNEIKVIEYDGTNEQKLYGGNFNQKLIVPSLDGTHLITITSTYPGASDNLYAITIK